MRRILVVVDMQNDFVEGALGTKEAQAIVGRIVEKIRAYPRDDVYATRDTHEEDYLSTAEGRHLPVVHCVRDTNGWELIEEVKELVDPGHVIDKPSFGAVEMAKLLLERSLLEEITVELVGVCTDICVVSNALLIKAYMPETEVSVDAGCCAGVTPESHEAAVRTMEMCQINI